MSDLVFGFPLERIHVSCSIAHYSNKKFHFDSEIIVNHKLMMWYVL